MAQNPGVSAYNRNRAASNRTKVDSVQAMPKGQSFGQGKRHAKAASMTKGKC